MKPDGFVVDTNVLISAALRAHSVAARCVTSLPRHGRMVFSAATFGAVDSRVWRPQFDRYISIEDRRLLLHDLGAAADWVDPPQKPRRCVAAIAQMTRSFTLHLSAMRRHW